MWYSPASRIPRCFRTASTAALSTAMGRALARAAAIADNIAQRWKKVVWFLEKKSPIDNAGIDFDDIGSEIDLHPAFMPKEWKKF